MKSTRPLVLLPVLAFALLLAAGRPQASDVLGKELDTPCTTCHDKPGSKLLTDRGKYYEAFRTFDGYDEIARAFSACTDCHTRRPGSMKLTENGQRFQELVGDMDGLRAWLEQAHPRPSGEGEPEREAR